VLPEISDVEWARILGWMQLAEVARFGFVGASPTPCLGKWLTRFPITLPFTVYSDLAGWYINAEKIGRGCSRNGDIRRRRGGTGAGSPGGPVESGAWSTEIFLR